MAGKKGRSGRKPSPIKLIQKALRENDTCVPKYLVALREIAFDEKVGTKDRLEALEYLVNRSQGTPKGKDQVLHVKGQLLLTPDQMAMSAHLKSLEEEVVKKSQPELAHKLLPLLAVGKGEAISGLGSSSETISCTGK